MEKEKLSWDNRPDLEYLKLMVDAWIESHPGPFSPYQISKDLGIAQHFCQVVANIHPLVTPYNAEIRGKSGPQKRFFSNASLPEATLEGMAYVTENDKKLHDRLGQQAREDFFELVEERGRNLKRMYRIRPKV